MMRAMLEAAVNWIRAGLPLKCFKIVVYGNPNRIIGEDKEVVAIFQQLKQKFEKLECKPQVCNVTGISIPFQTFKFMTAFCSPHIEKKWQYLFGIFLCWPNIGPILAEHWLSVDTNCVR